VSRRPLPRAAGLLALLLAACQGTPEAPPRTIQPPSPPPPLASAAPAPPAAAGAAATPAAAAGESDPGKAAAKDPAAAAPDATSSAADAASVAAGAPIGSVAGRPLSAGDLIVEWHRAAGREVWLVVDKLVATRLAYAEAERLGLRLDPAAVEARAAEALQRAKEEIAKKDPDSTFEEHVERELEEPVEEYERLLRIGTIRQMLVERAVRSWTLESENRALRIIVLNGDDDAQAVLGRLEAGEDFEALAREKSIDDTAKRGGWVPYVVRQEVSPLARLAFRTAPGEVGGPLAIDDAGHVAILRVEKEREPLEGDWPAIRDAVEASLTADPLSDAEFLHWKLEMERRYPIDVQPLERLLAK